MRPKILMVDDKLDLLAGLIYLLREDGIDVETHDSIITLPLIIRQANPDLILLDLTMPALSGKAVFKMGRDLLRSDAPLVLFSGCSSETLAKSAEDLGADGFITKSDEPADIIARIHSWIDHRRAVLAASDGGIA